MQAGYAPLGDCRDGDEVTRIVAGVLRRLWKPPRDGHPFRLLADAAASWADELPEGWERLGRPYEEELLTEAVAFLREAGPAQGEQVVLHQDLHGGNVLHAQREPWLAIDPKPLVGEREFDTASFLRDRRWELRNDPDAGARVRRRLDLLATELGLDRDRMRGWSIAHALAWGMSGKPDQDRDMVACARWLAAAARASVSRSAGAPAAATAAEQGPTRQSISAGFDRVTPRGVDAAVGLGWSRAANQDDRLLPQALVPLGELHHDGRVVAPAAVVRNRRGSAPVPGPTSPAPVPRAARRPR